MIESLEELTEKVKEVLWESQHAPDLYGVNGLMEAWKEAKQDYIDIFEGKYIYDCGPVSFQQSQTTLSDNINKFMNLVSKQNGGTLQNLDFFAFLSMQGSDSFFDNIVKLPYKKPDGTQIPVGMKMGRAFRYFFEDKKMLDWVQTQYSIQISAPKMTGHLYLSVHPLDYLSISENNANWTSCHGLHGDYRAGNLGYMTDESTIICYIADPEPENISNFPKNIPWNSKKWRMLLYVGEDVMFAGRQYPFELPGALEKVGDYFLALSGNSKSYWSKWHDDNFNPEAENFANGFDRDQLPPRFKEYVCIRKRIAPISDYVIDAEDSMHYNDVLRSGHYKPAYRFRLKTTSTPEPITKKLQVVVGSRCTCINCNEDRPVAESNTMLCEECDLKYNPDVLRCDCCGDRVWDDETYTLSNGDVVCEGCYDEYCERCASCEEDFYKDDMYYDEDSGEWYCYDCWRDMQDN